MKHVRAALLFSLLERYISIVLAFGSNMLLARLLTPAEIGTYSVTLAAIGVAHVLRDFGVGSFLIQKTELDRDTVRSAFGVALLIGGLLFGLLCIAAPSVGRFYDSAQLTGLMYVVALNFLILPFCTVSLSLLRRDMKFRALMWVNLSATLSATATTVAGAYAGWGPMCMAVGAIVGNLATAVSSWWMQGREKAMLPSLKAWRPIARFGAQSVSAGVVTSVAMDINDLVVGRVLGLAPVAISSRAQSLMNLFHRDFMSAIRGVMFPAFAQAHRNAENVDASHTAAVVRITALAWPFYGFVALNALEVLRLLFGPQWDAAAGLVPIFCLAGAVVCTSSLTLSLLTAVGRNDLAARAELVFQPLRAALVAGAAIYFRDLQACAWAYCFSFMLHPFWLFHLKGRLLPTNMQALLSGMLRSAAVTLAALAVPLVFLILKINGPLELALSGACTAIAWLAALHGVRHPLASDLDIVKRLKSALKSRKKFA